MEQNDTKYENARGIGERTDSPSVQKIEENKYININRIIRIVIDPYRSTIIFLGLNELNNRKFDRIVTRR